uniref:Uncharacterized protein n=1 Tax=Tetranychus urticae TaxID=32264 RepID=T1KHE4_TETUR
MMTNQGTIFLIQGTRKVKKKGDDNNNTAVGEMMVEEEDNDDESYQAEKESSPSISLEVASDSCSSVEFQWNNKENIKLETDCPGDLVIRQEVTEETDSSHANPSRISFVSSISYTIKSYDPLEEERSFIQRMSTREKELGMIKDIKDDDEEEDDDEEGEEIEKREKKGNEENKDVRSPGLSLLSTGFLNDAKNKPITGIGVKSKRKARIRESRRESITHCNANNCSSSSSDDNGSDCLVRTHKPFMVRHHSDETLNRGSSRIDRRTNRYYRRRSQEFIFKPLSSYIVTDPNVHSPSSCNVDSKKATTADDVTSSDSEIRVTTKPPLTTIQLQWVKSNIYSPRRSLRRNSEESISCHLTHPSNASEIQSTVSLDNLIPYTHNKSDSRPDNQTNIVITSNNQSQYEVNFNRSTNASVDSVDFRCLDDFLPKISSSDPVIYRKYDLTGEDQVDKVSHYDSMLTVSISQNTGESHSSVNHLSPTNDSGVSSQSVASSPILSQAPSPPPRNRIGKLTSIYGSIIKQRSSSAASSITSPIQSHQYPSVSSSCSDLYRRQLGVSSSRNNDSLSQSYHGESIEYDNNNKYDNSNNSNNAINEACSKHNEASLIKPKNDDDNYNDEAIINGSSEMKKSVRDIIANIESNIKSSTCSGKIIPSTEKFNSVESDLKSVIKINSTKGAPNDNNNSHSNELIYPDQQRRANIVKREQFRKQREPFITQVHLPNRYTPESQLEESSFLNRPKPKPSSIINLNSWSRPKPNKFLNGTKFRKIISKNSKIRKLDEAISELEEIYANLNLDDEDLLDRAERRDMPTKFQLMRFQQTSNDINDNYKSNKSTEPNNSSHPPPLPTKKSIYPPETGWKHPHCESFCQNRHRRRSLGCVESLLASSDPPYREKAPPRRRSAIPDPVSDDLAARKMVKNKSQSRDNLVEDKKIPSYLLLSPIYSPSSREDGDEMIDDFTSLEPEPDIEKDDLSYRKFTQSEAASVTPPHPPFGIPIGFTDLSTINNYVQATLSEKDRNFFYYRVKPYYPHLIKDDMAFRNFRKDLDKSQDELRKSWSDGIKLLPITTKHLISQRNETRERPTSLNLPYNNNSNGYYHHRYHPHPTRVSLIANEFENQGSLV